MKSIWHKCNAQGVSKNDTDFLDVIHTDHIAGYNTPFGHVDFYPNKGHSQPMCLCWSFRA